MLVDRVTTLRRVLMFEPHRYRHVVGPVRIDRVDGRGRRGARRTSSPCASCMTARPACSPPAAISTASIVEPSPFRFIERIVVLDSQKIDTLLVIPL